MLTANIHRTAPSPTTCHQRGPDFHFSISTEQKKKYRTAPAEALSNTRSGFSASLIFTPQ